MNLEELQHRFQDIVLTKECTDADWVSEREGRLPSRERLAIYHNAYRIRLIEVLRENFAHTVIYLGDHWFNQLASDYVQSHYSTYNNIGYYGHQFAEFVANQLPEDKEVAELAELDWVLRRVFDGKDSVPLTMETLSVLVNQDPDNFCLTPVQTMTLISHEYNTLDIWHAIDKDSTPPEVMPLAQRVDVLIWRKAHSPHFRSISPLESLAIQWVREGHAVNEIGEALQNRFPDVDVSNEFGLMLQRWINDEVLAF